MKKLLKINKKKSKKKLQLIKKFDIIFKKSNLILLGLLMLVSGSSKLFIAGPEAISVYLASLGFPIAGFFAWVLIIAEIGSGIAILARWKLDIVKFAPAIILLVAVLTDHMGDLGAVLIRLVLISNYLLLKQK